MAELFRLVNYKLPGVRLALTMNSGGVHDEQGGFHESILNSELIGHIHRETTQTLDDKTIYIYNEIYDGVMTHDAEHGYDLATQLMDVYIYRNMI